MKRSANSRREPKRSRWTLSDPASWTFKHLAVEREAGVTLVRFREPHVVSEEIVNGIRDDFSLLAEHLYKDSRILLDFTGVESSNSALITILNLFSRKLRTKGSRIVLCGLNPAVRETFFAAE